MFLGHEFACKETVVKHNTVVMPGILDTAGLWWTMSADQPRRMVKKMTIDSHEVVSEN